MICLIGDHYLELALCARAFQVNSSYPPLEKIINEFLVFQLLPSATVFPLLVDYFFETLNNHKTFLLTIKRT